MEGPLVPTPSLPLVTRGLSDGRGSDPCAVTPPCSSDLRFSKTLIIFHVPVGHLSVFSGQSLLRPSVRFLMGLLAFLLLRCMSCLRTLERKPLSIMSFANDFSQSVGCRFTLFVVSITVKKLLGLIQFSRSVVSDSLRPHELQHARPRFD